jgi:hypothetical protein
MTSTTSANEGEEGSSSRPRPLWRAAAAQGSSQCIATGWTNTATTSRSGRRRRPVSGIWWSTTMYVYGLIGGGGGEDAAGGGSPAVRVRGCNATGLHQQDGLAVSEATPSAACCCATSHRSQRARHSCLLKPATATSGQRAPAPREQHPDEEVHAWRAPAKEQHHQENQTRRKSE